MEQVYMFLKEGINSIERVLPSYPVFIIVLTFCLIATYTDITKLKIPNKLNAVFACIHTMIFIIYPLIKGDVSFAASSSMGGLLGFVLLLIPAVFTGFKMAGDIKFIGALGIAIGVKAIIPFILLSVLLNIIVNVGLIFLKKKSYEKVLPFAPFFTLSFLILVSLSQ